MVTVRLLLASTAFATASLSAGCSAPYYWQAASGQLALLRSSIPIEEVLSDPETPPEVREALEQVLEIRRFAIEELGLPDNGSYNEYADLEREYVVWNVVAAEEFSVDPVTWCFPFAGCVSYRGYFKEEAARGFSERLRSEGMDVAVGGATAYSTLGYFSDPVLSTMVSRGESAIAALLIHELAHQKLYIKDDSELNEAFATAVEEYGTELWLERNAGEEARAGYLARQQRRSEFTALISKHQEMLRSIYASPQPDDQKRSAKAAAFDTLRDEYALLKDSWEGATDYDGWFDRPLNNAHLASIATYHRWLPGLRWLLETRGLDEFFEATAALADLDTEARGARLQEWLDAAIIEGNADTDRGSAAPSVALDSRGRRFPWPWQ